MVDMMQIKEDYMLTAAHGMEQCESSVAGKQEVEVPREFHVGGYW